MRRIVTVKLTTSTTGKEKGLNFPQIKYIGGKDEEIQRRRKSDVAGKLAAEWEKRSTEYIPIYAAAAQFHR